MCAKLNSLFDREMKFYYVTQVLKQGIYNVSLLEFRNTKLQIYLDEWDLWYWLQSSTLKTRDMDYFEYMCTKKPCDNVKIILHLFTICNNF